MPQGVEYLRIGGMYDADGNELDFSPAGFSRMIRHAVGSPEHFMRSLYVSMLFGNPAVHALVDRMALGRAPLYFHCTAGKDRTGVCAAIVLTLLGVPDDAIVCDFLLTNEYRASIINMAPQDMPAWVSELERQNWAKMNEVSEVDLRGALAEADRRHGVARRTSATSLARRGGARTDARRLPGLIDKRSRIVPSCADALPYRFEPHPTGREHR